MESLRRGLFASLLFILFSACALAEDGKPGAATAVSGITPGPVRTGKERLGPKWSDEQRIDNCKVPADKRGTKPRPSACGGAPSS